MIMRVHHYLSLRQIADRAKAHGLKLEYNTIKSLAQRRIHDGTGNFPLPDAQVGEHTPEGGGRQVTYGWLERTIDEWMETR